jgi:hypothetical protein
MFCLVLCVGEECTPTQDKNCKIVGVPGYTIKNAHFYFLEGYIDVPGVHQSMVYPPTIRNALRDFLFLCLHTTEPVTLRRFGVYLIW